MLSRSHRRLSAIIACIFLVYLLRIDNVSQIDIHRPRSRGITQLHDALPLDASPKIAKVTMTLSAKDRAIYEPALTSHIHHARLHSYPLYLFEREIVDGIWNKQTALLELLLSELNRPESQRLQWLMWVDADTLVLNPHVPLELFVPPATLSRPVEFLYTKDWNGFNAGVFFLRVSSWAVDFMAAVTAFRIFRPDMTLSAAEQTAMATLLQMERFGNVSIECPSTWWNAYPPSKEHDIPLGYAKYKYSRGQHLMHFAGDSNKTGAFTHWLHEASIDPARFAVPLQDLEIEKETTEFWVGLQEKWIREEPERRKKLEEQEEMMKASGEKEEEGRKEEVGGQNGGLGSGDRGRWGVKDEVSERLRMLVEEVEAKKAGERQRVEAEEERARQLMAEGEKVEADQNVSNSMVDSTQVPEQNENERSGQKLSEDETIGSGQNTSVAGTNDTQTSSESNTAGQ